MDDVAYEYCLDAEDGRHIPKVLPAAAGGRTNICAECGINIPHASPPEYNPF